MGAVYAAMDRELNRIVALKVIHPNLVDDPEMLQRLRQEVVLARQVTHTNVVRIFDLGIVDGLRFISMEFIEGRQLSSVLDEKRKLPPRDAAAIVLQICRGLAATHEKNIVHRDLKPQNIMVEKGGRVVVMDFGIAHTGIPTLGPDREADTNLATNTQVTQLGAILGTPVYMSPEQAKGQPVDARADLFTVGVIFYELLTGTIPFLGKSISETLRKRCEEPAVPPVALNPQVPKALNEIILKCLEINPARRYRRADELIGDLEKFLGITKVTARHRKWLLGSVAASLIAAGVFVIYEQNLHRITGPHAPVEILIADLKNETGDSLFNGSLEPLISIAMEDSSFINAYGRAQAHKLAAELHPGATDLDASLAQLVALREGVNVVISGDIEETKGKYRVTLQARDGGQGTPIKSSEINAGSREAVLESIGRLVAPVRKALGDTTPLSTTLEKGETFSAASLEAAHMYAQAQTAQQSGNWDDAVRLYKQTLNLDPNSGRAYAGLASTLKNMGRRQEAQKYYQLALTKLDRMSDREKFRTRGGYFLFMGKAQQAMEQEKALVAAYPFDTAGLTNLAYAYFLQRDMTAAMRLSRQAADVYPNNVLLRNNAGLFAMYAGDFPEAIRQSRETLKINPKFPKALLCIALSQLAQGNADDAQMTWRQESEMGKEGASESAMGLADLALYGGRFQDAIDILLPAIAADLADKNVSEAALKQIALAQAYLSSSEPSKAVAAAHEASSERSDEPVAFPAAQILLDAGEEAQARSIAARLSSSFDPTPRAYAELIDGLIKLKHNNFRDAVSAFQAAQKLSDTWLGRLALAQAYSAAGAFAEADAESENCILRIGEATAVFFDDEPSLRYLPTAYYYRGRAREGLHIASAAADYQMFLRLKAQSGPDPQVTDAKHRSATQ